MSITYPTWIERARTGDFTHDEIMASLKEAERRVRVVSGALAVAAERNRVTPKRNTRRRPRRTSQQDRIRGARPESSPATGAFPRDPAAAE